VSVLRSQCCGEAEFKQALREEFATAALQGMCGNSSMPKSFSPENAAKAAYVFADAMLAAREARS
jgi:hypothetical protein